VDILFIPAIAIGVIYTLSQLLITFISIRRANGAPDGNEFTPAVSILKPLKGLDDQIELNLASFFTQDYPRYELIFGVNDIDDPAIPLVNRLIARYPEVSARLVISDRQIGMNPKINNLNNIYPHASHEFILISDSNVRVQPDYLRKMALQMQDERVGLITASLRGAEERTLGAVFENLHINTFIMGGVLVASRMFRIPVSIGKSMLMRRKTIEEIGGFAAFSGILAEDYFISLAVRKRGYRIINSAQLIDNVNENWSMRYFFNRHSRWSKMRKSVNALHYLAEVFTFPVTISLLYALYLHNSAGIAQLLAVIFIRLLTDTLMLAMVQSRMKLRYYLLLPVKDILISMIWLIPFFSNRINWRGNKFIILKNTRLQPLTGGL
jgi:ceramide glucosyltransferase